MNTILTFLRGLLPHTHQFGAWQPALARHTTSVMYRCGVQANRFHACACGAEEVECGKHY